MSRAFYFLVFISLAGIPMGSHGQGISGTWEGRMGTEYLQVNIVQKKNELCGFTHDYNIYNPREYCKAYFRGWYDKSRDVWILVGTNFIANSGSHILMQIKLWAHERSDNLLHGSVDSKDAAVSLLNWSSGESVTLRKVPTDPAFKSTYLAHCFPKTTRPAITEKKDPMIATKPVKPPDKKNAAKPAPPKSLARKTPVVVAKADTLKRKVTPPPMITPKTDVSAAIKKLNERKNTEFSHLQVSVKQISLAVYDNGVVDNDTVSIFYNGRLLAGKKLLSEKALIINLELDENAALHEITLFAENLGSIPPNTALIVVKAGDKRYELHSKASLEENAVLVFEYKPAIK